MGKEAPALNNGSLIDVHSLLLGVEFDEPALAGLGILDSVELVLV